MIDLPSTPTPLPPRKPHLNFSILRMENIYDEAAGKTDAPHRHEYYTVLLVEDAGGEHIIDYHSYKFGPRQVYFVSPGQVHQVITPTRPLGRVITFSREFLITNNIPESFISNINLFRQFGEAPPLEIDQATFERLMGIFGDMEACLPMEMKYRDRALGALLQLFLIYCNNQSSVDASQLDEENSGICILRDFKQLVDTRFREWHKVAAYASEIHVSPKHLSQTIKNITGKTAKGLITDRIVLEAKRLLLHTDLSVKEISFRLGFEEPLHFSGFFRKNSGVSATDFRKGNW